MSVGAWRATASLQGEASITSSPVHNRCALVRGSSTDEGFYCLYPPFPNHVIHVTHPLLIIFVQHRYSIIKSPLTSCVSIHLFLGGEGGKRKKCRRYIYIRDLPVYLEPLVSASRSLV